MVVTRGYPKLPQSQPAEAEAAAKAHHFHTNVLDTPKLLRETYDRKRLIKITAQAVRSRQLHLDSPQGLARRPDAVEITCGIMPIDHHQGPGCGFGP